MDGLKPIHRSFFVSTNESWVSLTLALSQDPGGHAAVVLDDGCFERIDEDGVQLVGQIEEHVLIDEEPLGTVAHSEDVGTHRLEVHSDSGAETAEQHAPRA